MVEGPGGRRGRSALFVAAAALPWIDVTPLLNVVLRDYTRRSVSCGRRYDRLVPSPR